MIRYALTCDRNDQFEGWFSSSDDFDVQAKRGLIECPVCGSCDVKRQIMAPAVTGTKAQTGPSDVSPKMRSVMMEAMGKIRTHVEDNFDYVGDAFAKEARDIHDGKSEERGIYGEATPKDVKSLVEDGVQVAALPPKPKDLN